MSAAMNPRRSWRSQLIAARIREFENVAYALERKLSRHAGRPDIRDAVLQLRELDARAGTMWAEGELDFADNICAQAEQKLIELRRAGRDLGVVL